MVVYVVNEVCTPEYGLTEIKDIYLTYEKAKEFVDKNQYKWSAWWNDKEYDAFTISEWNVKD